MTQHTISVPKTAQSGTLRSEMVMNTALKAPCHEEGPNGLLFGDCIQHMGTFPEGVFDLIVTDPPYLARFEDRTGRRLANDDNPDWLVPAFREAFRVLRANRFMVCFYGWHKADLFLKAWRLAGFRPVGHFVAPKRYTSRTRLVQYQHEMAYLLTKGEPRVPGERIPDVLPWKYSGNRWHPTEKPICTLIPLIRAFTARGEGVFDPFAGSASTLVAAALEGRRYCGVELDSNYFALAQRRVAACEARLRAGRVTELGSGRADGVLGAS